MSNQDKDKLLTQLQDLGVHPSGRKIRSDKGQSRVNIKPRSDKGKSRQSYTTDGSAYHRKVYTTLLRANSAPNGDTLLTMDKNLIFPSKITGYYVPDRRTSVQRNNHPELLRWRWLFAEYNDASGVTKDFWKSKVLRWYFIKEKDLPYWTYEEWAFAYDSQIDGHENRRIPNPIILDYDDFLNGKYGFPNLL